MSTNTGPNDPTMQMMMYDANKKSVGVAFALWIFFGLFGGHRYYCGKIGSAVAMSIIFFLSLLLMVVGIGFLGLGALGIWAIIDAFMISDWVRSSNNELINQVRRINPS